MFSSRLEAEGIPSFVAHSHHVGVDWAYSVALGGAKVQVLAHDLSDARDIEALCRRGDLRALLEREFGPLGEVHCPNCGSTKKWKRRPLVGAVAALSILFVCGVLCPPVGWVYFCENCGAKYRAPLYRRPAREWQFIIVAVLAIWAGFLVSAFALYWAAQSFEHRFLLAIVAALFAAARLLSWINRSNTEAE